MYDARMSDEKIAKAFALQQVARHLSILMGLPSFVAACLLPEVGAMPSQGAVEQAGTTTSSDHTAMSSSPRVDQTLHIEDLVDAGVMSEAIHSSSGVPAQSSGVGGESGGDAPQLNSPAGAGGASPTAANAGSAATSVVASHACETNNGGCSLSPMALCTADASGERICSCPSGYSGDGVGDSGCVDVDECEVDNGGCSVSPRAMCTNQRGAPPTCACPAGYLGSGRGTDGCVPGRTADGELVTDGATGLVWQRYLPAVYDGCTCTYGDAGREAVGCGDVGEACMRSEAIRYCASLALEGGDWRLPSMEELAALIDNSRTTPPLIDLDLFPGSPSARFWSSSVSPEGCPCMNVDFDDGSYGWGSHQDFAWRVRCVRTLRR